MFFLLLSHPITALTRKIKQKATNKLIDTTLWWLPEGKQCDWIMKRVKMVKYMNERRTDFGWWTFIDVL